MNCRLRNVPFRGLHANCTSTAQTSTASFRKILSTPICSAEFPSFSDAISSKSFLTTSRNVPNRGFRILHKHLPRFGCFYRFILSDKALGRDIHNTPEAHFATLPQHSFITLIYRLIATDSHYVKLASLPCHYRCMITTSTSSL